MAVRLDRKTHTYAHAGEKLPGVNEILVEAGVIDTQYFTQFGRDRGTAVHLACAYYDQGILDPDSVDPIITGYLEGWKKFRIDYSVSFQKNEVEYSVMSRRWRFAGTPDRLGKIKNKVALLDLKSAASMHPAIALQTAAYKIAVEEETGRKVRLRWGIQLFPDGKYRVHPYEEKTDEAAFLAALQLVRWKRRHL